MQRVVNYLLLAIVFTLPWEEVIWFGAAGSLSRWIAYIAIVAGIGAALAKGGIRPLVGMHYIVGLFVLWACFSLLWTENVDWTIIRVSRYLRLMGLAWMVWEFADTLPKQRRLMFAYLLGACVPLAGQIVMLLTHRGARFAGGGLNLNQLAFIYNLAILLAVYLATHPQTRSRMLRLLCWACCPAFGFGVLITASRSGLIVLIGATAFGMLLNARRRVLSSVVMLAIAAIVVAAFLRWAPEETIKRVTGTQQELTRGTWTSRLLILKQGLQVAADNPIAGTGAGTFKVVVGSIRERSGRAQHQKASHNTYLGTVVQTGAVGFLLLGATLAIALTYSMKMPPHERVLWMVFLATWGVSALAIDLNVLKPSWVFLALLTSQYVTQKSRSAVRTARQQSADAGRLRVAH